MSAASNDAPKREKRQPTGDYPGGYCRPPKSGQFQKGEPSRNPAGRPRRSKGPDAIIDKASRALVSITHNGKVIRVTRFDAMIRTVFAKAFQGCSKAQAELLSLRLKYARKRQSTPDDDDVVHQFTLRLYDQREDEPKQMRRRKARASMRCRKNETCAETFKRVSSIRVPVNDSGIRKWMTFEDALWNMIWASALGGNIAAVRLLMRFADAISECESQNSQNDDDEGETYTLHLGTLIDDNRKEDGEEDDPEPAA